MNNKINDYIIHYASKYYDPVKAHEYYMRTRELKGRRSSASLNDKGKEIWSYTKNQITNSKKASINYEKEKKDAKIAAFREKAKTARTNITAKLKQLKEKLSEESASKKSSVDSNIKRQIEQLKNQNIPENLSAERKAELRLERSEKIAALRAESKSTKSNITLDTKEKKSVASVNASEKRKEVASKLKAAISAAREAFKNIKAGITASYETVYQNEYDKIKEEYAKTKAGYKKVTTK